MIFKENKTYDILKWICITAMPAAITFYGVVGATCNLPYTKEVLTIAAAFNTMLGVMLGVSSVKYNANNQ